MNSKMRNYLSFGGGVNSVALHLLLLDQGVDFESVFVNHGTDWPETYDYVAGFQWWLKANGHRPITVLRPIAQGFQTVFDYCWAKQTFPSFMSRWCTDKFKIRTLKKHMVPPAFSMLGIDAGETKRAKIIIENGVENRYPLIENDIDRRGCIEIIKANGLPIPPKSGCYICPFQRRKQWVELRQKHPCLFRKAAELEQMVNKKRIDGSKKSIYLVAGSRCDIGTFIRENQRQIFEQDEYPPCQCGL